MTPHRNILSNFSERLEKIRLIQQIDEKPMVFFKFEEMPEHTFCLLSGEYIVLRELAIAYFFSHFYQISNASRMTDKAFKDSMEACSSFSTYHKSNDFHQGYYDFSWKTVVRMRQEYDPKVVLGWALDKNIKVI